MIKSSDIDSLIDICSNDINKIENIFDYKQIHTDYLTLQRLFYANSKWQIKLALKTINSLEIPIEVFYETFKAISLRYHNKDSKGQKSSHKFIEQLHKKVNASKLTHLNNDRKSLMKSLEMLKIWKNNYLKTSDKDFIKFIHTHLDFPYSLQTLRTFYYEETEKKSTKKK